MGELLAQWLGKTMKLNVLRAVDVPALHHMVDCVGFPQKGKRPHPNEYSGSDLDGDVYFVCWDPELIPPRQVQPMDYDAATTVLLDHDGRTEVGVDKEPWGSINNHLISS